MTTPTPRALPVARTLAFLRTVVPPASRVLEVGCGRGEVAAGLIAQGHTVVALDPDAESIAAARSLGVDTVEAGFLDYDVAASFDVVLFTRSLHHIEPLPGVIAHAGRLTVPGGLVVADEFARERVDADTAAWHFDTCAVLADAGLLDSHEPPGAGGDPLRRWLARFEEHGHHMTTGAEMLSALSGAFALTRVDERVPYHYRFVAERLPATAEGLRVATRLLAIERRRIALSGRAWAGLRVVARAVP